MTPFIIWLEKTEIDSLLSILVRSNQNIINDEVISQNQLLELTEHLLTQNNEIIKFLKKMQPFDKLQQNAAYIHGVQQKCNYYQELKPKIQAHCAMHKNELCKECPH